jgi:3D (Asp-Asp-Asp) domain-containing protein
MNSNPRRRAVVAVVVAALALAIPAGRLGASHFSWLGHTPCPGTPTACETMVPAGFTALGEFAYSPYRIVDERAAEGGPQEATEVLLAPDGKPIARVSRNFRRQLDEAGTARLSDGQIVNVGEKVNGTRRYLVVRNAPFGLGAPGYKLMPYRTVAVQPKRIPLGTVLYVPSVAGTKLPNGEIHDGFCFAHDTGGGANSIGIFLGFDRDVDKVFPHLAGRRALRVYRVDEETAAKLNHRFKDQSDQSS